MSSKSVRIVQCPKLYTTMTGIKYINADHEMDIYLSMTNPKLQQLRTEVRKQND